MRTTVFLNLKGGVAKTTTVINTAAILASEHKKRVLIIDADSQGNTTEFFGGNPAFGSLAVVLRDRGLTAEEAYEEVGATGFRGIDLLCADETLMDLDLSAAASDKAGIGLLRETLRFCSGNYDYCLIDCPPAFNAATAAALIAADDVVVPIKLDAFSLRGMANISRQVKNMQALNPSLRVAGYLPTMWYRSAPLLEAEATLRATGLPVFRHIRRSDKVDGSTFEQQPLLIASPRCAAGIDYRAFVREYIAAPASKSNARKPKEGSEDDNGV